MLLRATARAPIWWLWGPPWREGKTCRAAQRSTAQQERPSNLWRRKPPPPPPPLVARESSVPPCRPTPQARLQDPNLRGQGQQASGRGQTGHGCAHARACAVSVGARAAVISHKRNASTQPARRCAALPRRPTVPEPGRSGGGFGHASPVLGFNMLGKADRSLALVYWVGGLLLGCKANMTAGGA